MVKQAMAFYSLFCCSVFSRNKDGGIEIGVQTFGRIVLRESNYLVIKIQFCFLVCPDFIQINNYSLFSFVGKFNRHESKFSDNGGVITLNSRSRDFIVTNSLE